jgi:ferredoxin
MRIEIDRAVCQGHGVCQMTAPALFELSDEDGLAYTPAGDIPEELHDQARLAASSCPERAVTIVEN